MTEEEIKFKELLEKDPCPGKSNRLKKCSSKTYLIPGWVFNKESDVSLGGTALKLLDELGIRQILYDILVLGLTDINLRPKCPICGENSKFISLSKGYRTSCGNKNCISELSKIELNFLWKTEKYKKTQSDSHKKWASIEENRNSLKERSIKAWDSLEYRGKQSDSHKKWASIEENITEMRNRSLKLWSDPNYRKVQIESHKKYALEHPEEIKSGNGGKMKCLKSKEGTICYDSSWEKLFIEYSENSDIIKSIDRTGISIPYEYLGETKRYFPDFKITLIDGKNLMIEIKANWMIEKDEKTHLKLESGKNFINTTTDYFDYLVFTEDTLFNGKIDEKNFNKELITEILLKYITT